MKGMPLLFLLASVLPLAARAAEPVELHCKVYGMQAGSYEYKTVLDESWRFDPASITAKPKNEDGSCSPLGRKSRLFGDAKGTRLQFHAGKCGSDSAYYSATVLVNGLPLTQPVEDYGRITINESKDSVSQVVIEPGGERPESPPLSVPEGKFIFLYFDCDLVRVKGA